MIEFSDPPNDAPYTRHYLSSESFQMNFAVYDDARFGVTIITTTSAKGWRYPQTEVSPPVTRKEARSRYAAAVRQGLRKLPSFRCAHYGPAPEDT